MNLVPMCLCTFFGLPIAPFRTATDIFATPTSRTAASRAFGISWIFLGTYARSAIFFWQTHRIGGDISTMESRYVVGAKNRSAEYSLRLFVRLSSWICFPGGIWDRRRYICKGKLLRGWYKGPERGVLAPSVHPRPRSSKDFWH